MGSYILDKPASRLESLIPARAPVSYERLSGIFRHIGEIGGRCQASGQRLISTRELRPARFPIPTRIELCMLAISTPDIRAKGPSKPQTSHTIWESRRVNLSQFIPKAIIGFLLSPFIFFLCLRGLDLWAKERRENTLLGGAVVSYGTLTFILSIVYGAAAGAEFGHWFIRGEGGLTPFSILGASLSLTICILLLSRRDQK